MTEVIEAFSFDEALGNARDKIINEIPFFVIEIVNGMISDKLRKLVVDNDDLTKEICFQIGQDDLVDKIVEKFHELPYSELSEKYKPFKRNDIFDKHWLDFEPLYRKKGWNVQFEKILLSPERNSNYWIFKYKSKFC